MLEPGSRSLLLDSLRPPQGYRLDIAVGTTFTLDLLSLLSTPVAFAMFDRQDRDGATVLDPVATLQALRDHASKITIFCQAGMISVPPQFRNLLVYLEDSIHPVTPPKHGAIFHPKVWFLRYRLPKDGSLSYRLLCLSRNLTFDRSWDTILRLDGVLGTGVSHSELDRFTKSLIRMAEPIRAIHPDRVAAIHDLGMELGTVRWSLPEAFSDVRFWPMGYDRRERWPFSDQEWRRDPMLILSPFVTADTLHRLTRKRKGSILLTRPETLDALGGEAVKSLGERLVLSPYASVKAEDDADEADITPSVEGLAQAHTSPLHGLHAKAYVIDAGRNAHVWTGSANTTGPAFSNNVEFLVQLTGKKDVCGVQATIGDFKDRAGLRTLVEAYEPSHVEPLPPTEEEQTRQRLDAACRMVGGFRFIATCHHVDEDHWSVDLHGTPSRGTISPQIIREITTSIRPITLDHSRSIEPIVTKSELGAVFSLSEQAVTPFFVIDHAIGDMHAAYVIAANLIDPPPDRASKVMRELLTDRTSLIRFLLLLLGNIDGALGHLTGAGKWSDPKGGWLEALNSEALLEPLIRAYSRDPERLKEIERVLDDLGTTPDGGSVLPSGWNEIWEPIRAASHQRIANEHAVN